MSDADPIEPTDFSIPLLRSQLARMPCPIALGLAKHLIEESRPKEALDLLLETRVERVQTDFTYDSDVKLAQQFETASLLAAKAASDGAQRLMAAISARGAVSSAASGRVFNHATLPVHRSASGPALEKVLAAHGKEQALALVLGAPEWVCLHWFNGQQPRGADGFSQALGGTWGKRLLGAYLERDGFAKRLAASQGEEKALLGFTHIAELCFRGFDPEQDRKRGPALIQLLRAVGEASKADPKPHPETGSLLPKNWAAGLALGSFEAGRELAFAEFGREPCLSWARKEGSMVSDSRAAFQNGSLEAIACCADCFGTREILLCHQADRQKSAVAMMCSSMPADAFAKALDMFIERGARDALAESCSHRFWAVYEQGSSVRKMGDALAHCAAEGLIEHAEALIERLPSLERKDVKEVLAYMNKRDASKKGVSHSAWESLVIREAMKASPAPSGTRPRSRL